MSKLTQGEYLELVDELIETVAGYKPELDRDLLTRAFSFAAAAQRIALTQAAIGLQMRTLEDELRRPLFDRQGRSVRVRA